MKNIRTLVLTDNLHAYELSNQLNDLYGNIKIFQSPNGSLKGVPKLNVRNQVSELIKIYDLIVSIHCKQLFPSELVNSVRCINVHPGLNPYNRGWFPQVFSIINGLPSGVTIHEIDEQLDHGAIIAQREYEIQPWDTSGSAYKKIMNLEREIVLDYFELIQQGRYKTLPPTSEGNVNLKKDFDQLKYIDLEQRGTYGELIDRLRALTHDEFKNAFFITPSGKKVYVKIILEPEN